MNTQIRSRTLLDGSRGLWASVATSLALVVALCMPIPAHSQVPATTSGTQTPEATFTSNAHLVLVPVVVRQGKQHVAGLTQDDFTVLENGKPQRIAFAKVPSTGARLGRTTGNNVFSNEINSDAEASRLTIIALDTINTPFLDQASARKQITQFLANNLDKGQPTAVIIFGRQGISVIHDFTTDPKVLIAALQHVAGTLPVPQETDVEAGLPAVGQEAGQLASLVYEGRGLMLREGIEVLLEELAMVAHSYDGVPGRKTLVWVTGNFPFEIGSPGSFLSPTVTTPSQVKNLSQMGTARLLRDDELATLRPLYEKRLTVAR